MASRRAITKGAGHGLAVGISGWDVADSGSDLCGARAQPGPRPQALRQAFRPRVGRPRNPRPAKLDAKVVVALAKCWAVVNAPAGKRLARSWASCPGAARPWRVGH